MKLSEVDQCALNLMIISSFLFSFTLFFIHNLFSFDLSKRFTILKYFQPMSALRQIRQAIFFDLFSIFPFEQVHPKGSESMRQMYLHNFPYFSEVAVIASSHLLKNSSIIS